MKFDNSLREDAIIQIVDVLGRSIYAEEIPAFTQMRTIPVNNLSKGTYFLNVVYKGSNNVSTFIVE
ncbi:MAG TPA: T9SS type A sorting domain-containing protein [Chitinophagales bacterium]|nr:T9SS type A sorting domain-containing protein [Chitinophagales bacterium]